MSGRSHEAIYVQPCLRMASFTVEEVQPNNNLGLVKIRVAFATVNLPEK